jgi:hypothetical protein
VRKSLRYRGPCFWDLGTHLGGDGLLAYTIKKSTRAPLNLLVEDMFVSSWVSKLRALSLDFPGPSRPSPARALALRSSRKPTLVVSRYPPVLLTPE